MIKKLTLYSTSLLAAAAIGAANAGEVADLSAKDAPVTVAEEPSIYDKIWGLAHLYSNPDGFWLTDLKLIGRYHGQYVNVDSSRGNFDDWFNRRWRVGAEARILGGDWKLKGEINIDPDFDPFYRSLEEAYIAYQPSDAFNLTIGKHKPKWSYEWATSSRKILTFERSLIVNSLLPLKSAGISANGDIDKWSYNAGIFSGALDREFGGFDAGIFALTSLGYDLSEGSSLDASKVRFDYLYNGDSSNNATAAYRHSFSLNHHLEAGQFSMGTDLLYASGFDGDAWGFVVLPSYKITDKLEVVARYSYAHGDNNSLRGGRFARLVGGIGGGFRGEDHHAIYAGLNYYLYGHKLKIMNGIQYADMDVDGGSGYDAWTFFTGVRLYF